MKLVEINYIDVTMVYTAAPLGFIAISFLLNGVQCLLSSKFDLPTNLNNTISDAIFTSVVAENDPVNLGLGRPDLVPPTFMREALVNAARSWDDTFHQYMPPEGCIELRGEIAKMYSQLTNHSLDPTKNVVVTMGAMEATYLSVVAHTNPGDEWIIVEPAYERYFSVVTMAGGKVRAVRLRPRATAEGEEISSADLVLDEDELRSAFNNRTKGILVNNPHNPTGKVFTKEELLLIAELAIKWDTLIVFDEVYEWATFDADHIRMASLSEEIFERTITISSVSKAFFATGWRVGWAYGPPKLISNLKALQPYIVLSTTAPTQAAVTQTLKKVRQELGQRQSYFGDLKILLEMKRNFMLSLLKKIGVKSVVVPQAGYYIFVNIKSLESRADGMEDELGDTRDIKFLNWLVKNVGIFAYPGTSFYSGPDKTLGEDYIRICYAKTSDTLRKAENLLLKRFC